MRSLVFIRYISQNRTGRNALVFEIKLMEMSESLDMALLLDSENRPDFKHVSIIVLNCDFDHYPIIQNIFHVDPFVIHTKWN